MITVHKLDTAREELAVAMRLKHMTGLSAMALFITSMAILFVMIADEFTLGKGLLFLVTGACYFGSLENYKRWTVRIGRRRINVAILEDKLAAETPLQKEW